MTEDRFRKRLALIITLSLCILIKAGLAGPAAFCATGECEPEVRVSEPDWIIPADNLPPEIMTQASNCNVSIEWFDGRLFLAWRTAPFHFASTEARLYVMSSPDMGQTWEYDFEVHLGADLREPHLLAFNDQLIFTFFEAGTNPLGFEPQHMWRAVRNLEGEWSALETWGEEGEVPWEFKVHDGSVYLTTYIGEHYGLEPGEIEARFSVSEDGLNWESVGDEPAVYIGGVSEVAFEFDSEGNLWAVTRCEDGDDTGFGSHLVTAPAEDLSSWEFPVECDPYRKDSPRMFRHCEEIYLLGRRDPCKPYDLGWDCLPFDVRRLLYLVLYSLRPKRTALYRIDRDNREVDWVLDLPSAGDTSFPSVIQTGPDTFLVANYTSPLWFKWRTWLAGQISPWGTKIYLVELEFSTE